MDPFKKVLGKLKFSLRTLFVLVTLLSVWLGYQLHWIRQRREAREWLSAHGHFWSADDDRIGVLMPRAPLSLRIFGEQGVFFFGLTPSVDGANVDDKIAELRRLFPEAHCIREFDLRPLGGPPSPEEWQKLTSP